MPASKPGSSRCLLPVDYIIHTHAFPFCDGLRSGVQFLRASAAHRQTNAPPSRHRQASSLLTCSPHQTCASLSSHRHAAPPPTCSPPPAPHSSERFDPWTQAHLTLLDSVVLNKCTSASCPSCLSAFGFPFCSAP